MGEVPTTALPRRARMGRPGGISDVWWEDPMVFILLLRVGFAAGFAYAVWGVL